MFNQNTKFLIDYLNQNELNLNRKIGQKDLLIKKIYNSFNLFSCYDLSNVSYLRNHGPIYDLCFKPDDGKLLLAGTEENSLLIFDCLNHQSIKQVDNAHNLSINKIKFLDSNQFATCSNDTKILLWDLRNLSYRIRTLEDGHTHFIKNLEYDDNLKYLISSSLDGCVLLHDIINKNNDQLDDGFIQRDGYSFKKVLELSCLMRMRLTNDLNKMIISTADGYIMIIHDLDLNKLNEDIGDFQSDLYRLMQKKHTTGYDFGSWFNQKFTTTRNRVELISDFQNSDAHFIGSLDVHPFDWCILSRNLSRDENSEFTCIHNIQDYEKPNEMMSIEMPKTDIYYPHTRFRIQTEDMSNLLSNTEQQQERVPINHHLNNHFNNLNTQSHINPIIILTTRSRQQATLLNPNTSYRQIKLDNNSPPKIYCNLNRMTHYIDELNDYKLFFKESHFSKDGRFIISPYGYGYRLLSFNSECTELSDEMLNNSFVQPKKLNEIKKITEHINFVTTARGSPVHDVIASGCLNGKINFYQPVL